MGLFIYIHGQLILQSPRAIDSVETFRRFIQPPRMPKDGIWVTTASKLAQSVAVLFDTHSAVPTKGAFVNCIITLYA